MHSLNQPNIADSGVKKAQKAVDVIPPGALNNTGKLYINEIHNEFIRINGFINIPRLPVTEIAVADAESIIADIASFIPEFLRQHTVVEKRVPPSDQHMLHFIRDIPGRLISFTHIFKLDLKFGGDPSNIIEKGTSDFYPSYTTDRLYYKSLLVPKIGSSAEFTSLRLIASDLVISDQLRFTSALFDQVDKTGMTAQILEQLPKNIYSVSPNLYPFIYYDYFTACLSILHPNEKNLTEAAALYEPLFLFLYNCFNDIEPIAEPREIIKLFKNRLKFHEKKLQLNETFVQELQKYFSRYHLVQNDEMALKRWWEFVRHV